MVIDSSPFACGPVPNEECTPTSRPSTALYHTGVWMSSGALYFFRRPPEDDGTTDEPVAAFGRDPKSEVGRRQSAVNSIVLVVVLVLDSSPSSFIAKKRGQERMALT